MNNYIVYIILILILDLVGSIFAKIWISKGGFLYLGITMVSFGLLGLFFAKSLAFEGLAVTNIIVMALSIAVITIVSLVLFNENISFVQWWGIFVVVMGMIMINWK